MPVAESCARIERRLSEALLARNPAADGEARRHAETCASCRPLLVELDELRAQLETLTTPDAPESLVGATLSRARTLLGNGTLPARAARGLPEGYTSECLRLLGVALLPFPVVVAWNLALLAVGEQLLAPLLPAALLSALGVAYVAAAAGWSALLYGSIPILAHRRALRAAEVAR